MPKKTIVTKIALGVEDPDQDVAEVRDANGAILVPAARGIAHKKAGEPVTLDADEADRIIARFGGEVLEEIPDEAADDAAAAGAKASAKVARQAAA
jgi:hypothetical protein